MEKGNVLDISWGTIFKIFVTIFIFYFIYLTREISLWFFFALAISILLTPSIRTLRKLWIPKILAVIIIYFSIFGIIGLLIYLTAPIFIAELKQLSQNLPEYFTKISPVLQQIGVDSAETFDSFTKVLIDSLAQSSKGVISAVTAFLGGLYSTIFILTAAFFLSLEGNATEKFLRLVSPKKYEENIGILFRRAQNKVSRWFGARLLACLFVGVASFVVFYVFGVKYAFILALVAGVLNFVPYIGPWVTAILLLVFVSVSSSSWLTVFYVLVAAAVVQAVENNILTPVLMKKMVDMPPVLVLFSLLAGAKLFGFLGIIFAVPVFGIIFEFIKEFLERRKLAELSPEQSY